MSHRARSNRQPRPQRRRFPILLLLGGISLGFIGLCLWIKDQGRRQDLAPAEAIIVLGAAQWNGRPSPVLQARLDHAIELYEEGYAPLLLLTGGTGPGDQISEAAVGRAYAIDRGVPAQAIRIEEDSRTTVENLRGARELLTEDTPSVLLVSDPFHMARALRIARDVGLEPHAAPTGSSPISQQPGRETLYIVREALALVLYHLTGA